MSIPQVSSAPEFKDPLKRPFDMATDGMNGNVDALAKPAIQNANKFRKVREEFPNVEAPLLRLDPTTKKKICSVGGRVFMSHVPAKGFSSRATCSFVRPKSWDQISDSEESDEKAPDSPSPQGTAQWFQAPTKDDIDELLGCDEDLDEELVQIEKNARKPAVNQLFDVTENGGLRKLVLLRNGYKRYLRGEYPSSNEAEYLRNEIAKALS